MANMLVRRKGGTMVPAFARDVDLLNKIPEGSLVELQFKRSPSAKMRRFYWAILGIVVDNHPFYSDKEAIHDIIRIGVQCVRLVVNLDGSVSYIPRSTSDAAMNFTEFKEYFDKAVDFIVVKLLPGVVREEIIREIEDALGFTLEEAQAGNREKRSAMEPAADVIEDNPWAEADDGFDE